MSNVIRHEGFSYSFDPKACENCQGRCCTGESGYIYISTDEMKNIAELLGVAIDEFVNEYLFKKGYKYSIKERKVGDSYECIFYDKQSNGCAIYKYRPHQCKTFPFWDYYKQRVDALKSECPGVLDA